MRILITGGSGFLGTYLVKQVLRNPNSEVTVLDSLEFPLGSLPENLKPVWDRITYIRGSICNNKLLKELVPYQDIIYHCAAQTSHILSIQDPKADAEVNAEGTLKLLETLRFFNREAVLVYPSTTSVIGKPQQKVVDESHPLNPADIYSVHKVLSERYLISYAKFHGIRMVILRFGNLYGAYGRMQPEYGFINHFIHQAINHKTLQIYGSGDQIRNVMFAEDAADLMERAALKKELHGAFWFATSPYHLSVQKIAQQIMEVFQSGSLSHVDWPEERRQIEVGPVHFSSAALAAKIGPVGPTSFVKGLQKTLETLKNQSLNLPV